ncbi:hypothetical protein KNT81_gp177 [Proteus phage phiP4-3]|uniref:Uncharacterized protein n=1 Tax=Proteus phage phiP4-3 TaxID=2065203 RepID=A0A2I6PFV4_9CAUD|nr:hypothetical protein KNT81_gp177 [Proteus phage phiP4-3]AUM58594.1 hypothetical protein phiP43_236 [Proteus phage phiP4-3]AZV01167.1 hypothetical protein vBSdyM006_030 [Shigella phage vB_SdyM_006]
MVKLIETDTPNKNGVIYSSSCKQIIIDTFKAQGYKVRSKGNNIYLELPRPVERINISIEVK